MNLKNTNWRKDRLALACAIASLGAVGASPTAHAYSSDLREWRSTYPSSGVADNLSDPCKLCHGSARNLLNGYGWDYLNSNDFSAIESLNSDNDPSGTSNLDEINGNSQPGWTEGANNSIKSIDGALVTIDFDPPQITAGTIDPTATNQPPVADIGGPYSGTVNTGIEFDASASSDSDGSIASYGWDFGDGSSATGAKVSHTYASTGTYKVTLVVTDDGGESATDSADVTIGEGNQAPVADAKGPYTSVAGEEIAFDGSSSSDVDGSIASYEWSFGDGSSAMGENPTHTYTQKGTYNVTLTVTDNDGAMDSDETTVSVDPGNQPPVADTAGPYSANVNEKLVFDATGSSDPDGMIASYEWDFGDGMSGQGATPTHTY
ncbi:MAG: PKD domain-containing protein, partial [Candidatus Thiodiazotropha sp.]